MELMKAVLIHNYGGPEVLRYGDAPRPQLGNGEVLIRVHAAGVNPADWKVWEGHLKQLVQYKFPLILGWGLSGVIEEVGAKPAATGRSKKVTKSSANQIRHAMALMLNTSSCANPKSH